MMQQSVEAVVRGKASDELVSVEASATRRRGGRR